jgi:hypothetical protein
MPRSPEIDTLGQVGGRDRGSAPRSETLDFERAVALAAAVEALSSGPARTLAGDLRVLLEDARGATAEVVSLADRRTRR